MAQESANTIIDSPLDNWFDFCKSFHWRAGVAANWKMVGAACGWWPRAVRGPEALQVPLLAPPFSRLR